MYYLYKYYTPLSHKSQPAEPPEPTPAPSVTSSRRLVQVLCTVLRISAEKRLPRLVLLSSEVLGYLDSVTCYLYLHLNGILTGTLSQDQGHDSLSQREQKHGRTGWPGTASRSRKLGYCGSQQVLLDSFSRSRGTRVQYILVQPEGVSSDSPHSAVER